MIVELWRDHSVGPARRRDRAGGARAPARQLVKRVSVTTARARLGRGVTAAVLRQNFARTMGLTPTAYRARFSCAAPEAVASEVASSEAVSPEPIPA